MNPVAKPKKGVSVREHARNRGALGGTDAQALEGALTLTERERDEAQAKITKLEGTVSSLKQKIEDLERQVTDLERRCPIDGWALAVRTGPKYHLYKAGRSLCRKHKFKGPYTPLKKGEPKDKLDCQTCWNRAQPKGT